MRVRVNVTDASHLESIKMYSSWLGEAFRFCVLELVSKILGVGRETNIPVSSLVKSLSYDVCKVRSYPGKHFNKSAEKRGGHLNWGTCHKKEIYGINDAPYIQCPLDLQHFNTNAKLPYNFELATATKMPSLIKDPSAQVTCRLTFMFVKIRHNVAWTNCMESGRSNTVSV